MIKKIPFIVLAGLLILGGSGCSTTQATEPASAAQTTSGANAPEMTIENKLAAGTLMLESTELAVTAGQAEALLPLWKAVKALSSSDTASADEIQALYDQIQETMTAEQLAAIEAMSLTREDLSALMTDLGIDPGPGPGGMQNSDPTARATQMAREGGDLPGIGGDIPGGGMPPGAGFGGMGRGDDNETVQTTPQAGQAAGRRAGGGMGQVFIDPLITILEARAAQ
jgi:hypothetical protein